MGSRLTAAAHRPIPVPADLAVEAIKIPDPGSAGLAAWWAQASPERGAVLLLHGIQGDRRNLVSRVPFLRDAGFSVR